MSGSRAPPSSAEEQMKAKYLETFPKVKELQPELEWLEACASLNVCARKLPRQQLVVKVWTNSWLRAHSLGVGVACGRRCTGGGGGESGGGRAAVRGSSRRSEMIMRRISRSWSMNRSRKREQE